MAYSSVVALFSFDKDPQFLATLHGSASVWNFEQVGGLLGSYPIKPSRCLGLWRSRLGTPVCGAVGCTRNDLVDMM